MKIISEEDNIRIDKFLSNNTSFSRTTIDKMLNDNLITVNDKLVKPSYKINIDDVIELPEKYQEELDIKPVKMDIEIVYEDDDLMIINKPSGLVVHPGAGNYNNTLVNGLVYYTNDLSDDDLRPGIVHRIDKDTSGLMVVAKNNNTHDKLTLMFQKHDIKRTYIGLLCGVLPHDKVSVDAPIGRDPKNRKKMAVVKDGKKAITHLKVLKRYHENTLVELNLETGRTHQIRVHMNYIGYPLFNDPVYGKEIIPNFGQFLHSYKIEFNHPITNKLIKYECKLPEVFQEYIDNLD